ncbi:chitin deacetylase [Linnemannia zychae]|nr:chitin deacetylase [Linnemannia zychae]
MSDSSSCNNGKDKSTRSSAPVMLSRRNLALLAVLAMSTLSAVSAKPTLSTEEKMSLLSRPKSIVGDVDYHGVVPSFFEKSHFHGVSRNEVAPQVVTTEAQRERNNYARIHLNLDQYPTKDEIPDVNHPQVKAWVKEIDWSKVPKIPVAQGLPDAPRFPKCPPRDKVNPDYCWWSCDECLQPSDVVTCPTAGNWGLTYDDGPSEASREMMQHLEEKKLSATFFIVGSRVLEYPEILREEVAAGHHIAMHTWSHGGLTTLTNEQIVAEVKWTEKIIRDVTGLTMKYIRPPYGDCDNRVREILRQMGYTNVIWTQGWDTNDWRIPLNQIKIPDIIKTFNNALDNVAIIKSLTGILAGPITLEHDLTLETVDLSKKIIEIGSKRGLKPMNLAQCLNDVSPYQGVATSSIPLNNNATAQAPQSNINGMNSVGDGKSTDATNNNSSAGNVSAGSVVATPADSTSSIQDSSSSPSSSSATVSDNHAAGTLPAPAGASAAVDLRSVSITALCGIAAIASYFLVL